MPLLASAVLKEILKKDRERLDPQGDLGVADHSDVVSKI
jgi:hypothetical protein